MIINLNGKFETMLNLNGEGCSKVQFSEENLIGLFNEIIMRNNNNEYDIRRENLNDCFVLINNVDIEFQVQNSSGFFEFVFGE
jgi:hypothetical protein